MYEQEMDSKKKVKIKVYEFHEDPTNNLKTANRTFTGIRPVRSKPLQVFETSNWHTVVEARYP